MKSALLLLAHGSPRPTANRPIERIAEDLRARGTWDIVMIGYLDCNDPDIPTAIENCVAEDAREIVVAPCFLHAGNHVANDLPRLLKEAKIKHPRLRIIMSDYLGSAPQITEILLQRALSNLESKKADH
jgi:sirohydrochlorin ferrochelatase